jgi:hypothetical protein
MGLRDFLTRAAVADDLRTWRDGDIACNQRIAEAQAVLATLGRDDLLPAIKEPVEVASPYVPPTSAQLDAIAVGDVVRACTFDGVLGWAFLWHPVTVVGCTDDEVHGIVDYRGDEARITFPKTYVCAIDDRIAKPAVLT